MSDRNGVWHLSCDLDDNGIFDLSSDDDLHRLDEASVGLGDSSLQVASGPAASDEPAVGTGF